MWVNLLSIFFLFWTLWFRYKHFRTIHFLEKWKLKTTTVAHTSTWFCDFTLSTMIVQLQPLTWSTWLEPLTWHWLQPLTWHPSCCFHIGPASQWDNLMWLASAIDHREDKGVDLGCPPPQICCYLGKNPQLGSISLWNPCILLFLPFWYTWDYTQVYWGFWIIIWRIFQYENLWTS